MQLNNPKQERTLAEIIADLPDSVKAEAATRIARVNRLVAEQIKFDSAVAAALDRILMNAPPETLRPLAKQLRKRREIAKISIELAEAYAKDKGIVWSPEIQKTEVVIVPPFGTD